MESAEKRDISESIETSSYSTNNSEASSKTVISSHDSEHVADRLSLGNGAPEHTSHMAASTRYFIFCLL